jgi:chromosomal replication initiation ATPase DnaA
MADTRQLPLELALDPQFGEEDFLISNCNADAYASIESWPDWPSRMLVLTGPPASGKTHMAAIWAKRSAARLISTRALAKASVPALVGAGAVVVEDLDRGEVDETALFHLINLATEKQAFLLLTSGTQVPSFKTLDLQSRLRRIPQVAISAPDDQLILALLVKMFVDRQMVVDIALVNFLSIRIERSFKAARDTVETLDRETMARGRRLTRPLAAKILNFSPDE